MELFGFTIKKKEEELEASQVVSFAPKQKDDGATLASEGGIQGTYIDLGGNIRNESALITQYREMSIQPEVESAIDDIINSFISYDSEHKLVEINLDQIK